MDYHSMKRRELQVLCKEHNIPANSANSVLADKLSELLNEKQKPITRQRTCMKSSVETTDEGEPVAPKRQGKKVRFSPNNELVEYKLRSGEKHKDIVTEMKARRKSVAKKVDKPVVDSNTTVELNNDGAQIPLKLTRSRVQVSGKNVVIPNNEKKQGRSAAEGVEKGTSVDKETEVNVGKVARSKARASQKGGVVQCDENKQNKRPIKAVEKASESVGETVLGRVRVTRSKAQTLMENDMGPDVNPQDKKKNGKQVATHGQKVEPTKEIMDIPVRATRSRSQAVNEDIGNTVIKSQPEKKRTRREMKATDLSNNSSHVAPEDKQEPPKRKSSRTRGAETVNEDEDVKVEVVRVTRSKAPLVMEASRRDSRNKANKLEIQQLEEPVKHACKKDVNRRKSVIQPVKTEVVLHREVPVNRPARKSTQKSVMQRETKMVVSPNVDNKQSKGQSGNLTMIDEGLDDKENVTRLGKDDSQNELKEITTGSAKSRKRRGTAIIEDQTLENEYVSPVDKSPKRSTRSAGGSEGKSVAKIQVENSLKTPVARMNDSIKRPKLSETKQSDLDDHVVKSNKKGTPVSKMRNVKLDEKVVESELMPAIDESNKRFTRSAIRSERKESSQSAFKEQQSIGGAQLSSQKVAKFRSDPAVNTAPGRITRRGITHDGNTASSFSEKVDKKKQKSRSAHKKLLVDAQISSPEVAELGPNPDVDTIGVQSEIKQPLDDSLISPEVAEVGPDADVDTRGVGSEISKEVTGQILENLGDKTPLGPDLSNTKMTPVAMAEVSETVPDAVSDGSHIRNQNQEVYVESATSVLKSGRPEANENEMELTESGSTSKELETDVMVEEPLVSVGKTVVMEESVDLSLGVSPMENNGDADDNCDSMSYDVGSSAVRHGSFQQSDVKSKSEEMEAQVEPLISEGVKQFIQDDGTYSHQIEKVSEQDGLSCKDSLQNSSIDKHEVAHDGEQYDDGNASAQKPLMTEPVSEDRGFASDDKEDVVSTAQSLAEHGEMSTSKNVNYGFVMDRSDVADDVVDAGKEPAKELELEVVASNHINAYDIPIVGKSDGEDEGVTTNEEHESNPKPLTDIDAYDTSLSGKDDVFNIIRQPEPISEPANKLETGSEPSSVNKTLEVPVSGNDLEIEYDLDDTSDGHDGESEQLTNNDIPAKDEDDVGGDDSAPAQNESTPVGDEVLVRNFDQEPEQMFNAAVGQSDSLTGTDTQKTPATSGNDATVTRVDAPQESALDINKDVVSNILGDIYDTDTENDSGNEKKLTEIDEGIQPKESESVSPDLSNEQTTGKHTVATVDLDLDSGKLMEGGSNIGVKEVDSDLVGNVKAHEDPIREETSPIMYTKEEEPTVDCIDSSQLMGDSGAHDSPITEERSPITYEKEEYLPTSIKEDDGNKQEETQNSSTRVDWGGYRFGMDEFQIPVSANESDDVLGGSKKDDQNSNLQTSARTSSSIEESSSLAPGLANTVRDLEKDSRNAADGKSNQEVDVLKESANAADLTEEVFNWSDSSMKSLFATPAATQISHVRDGQEDAVNLANRDNYSSLKLLFKTPAVTQSSHVKDGEEDAVNYATQDPYSSLKPFSTAPAATQISHVKDAQDDAANFANKDPYSSLKSLFTTPATTRISHVKDGKGDFTFPDDRCNEDIGNSGTAVHAFNHQWENDPSKIFDGETQGNATQSPENEMYGVPNFEDYPHKLFEYEEVDGSTDRSGFEFKSDQDDRIKQFNLSAGTSHHDASGLKDNSICSNKFEKREGNLMKGSESDDDFAFDKGMRDL